MKNKKEKTKLNFSEKGLRELSELEPDSGVMAVSPELFEEFQINELAKSYSAENGNEYLSSLMEKCYKAGYKKALKRKAK